jgi:hypothetical protein
MGDDTLFQIGVLKPKLSVIYFELLTLISSRRSSEQQRGRKGYRKVVYEALEDL